MQLDGLRRSGWAWLSDALRRVSRGFGWAADVSARGSRSAHDRAVPAAADDRIASQ